MGGQYRCGAERAVYVNKGLNQKQYIIKDMTHWIGLHLVYNTGWGIVIYDIQDFVLSTNSGN